MDCRPLLRSYAEFWLAAVSLACAPLTAMAAAPPVSHAEQRALQEEVWEMWRLQPAPLGEVIFG